MSFAQTNGGHPSAILANNGVTLSNSSVITFADNTTQSTAAESLPSNYTFSSDEANFDYTGTYEATYNFAGQQYTAIFTGPDSAEYAENAIESTITYGAAADPNYTFTAQYSQVSNPVNASGTAVNANDGCFTRKIQTYVSGTKGDGNDVIFLLLDLLPIGWESATVFLSGTLTGVEVGNLAAGASAGNFTEAFYVTLYANSTSSTCVEVVKTGTTSSWTETPIAKSGLFSSSGSTSITHDGLDATNYTYTLSIGNTGPTNFACNFFADITAMYIKNT